MENPPVLDPQTLDSLRSLNPDDGDAFLREIITIYLEDTPLRLADLTTAMAAGDKGRAARAAHSVKGSSANIGAEVVRGIAEKIESRAKVGLDGLDPLVADLKAAFAVAEAALRKLI